MLFHSKSDHLIRAALQCTATMGALWKTIQAGNSLPNSMEVLTTPMINVSPRVLQKDTNTAPHSIKSNVGLVTSFPWPAPSNATAIILVPVMATRPAEEMDTSRMEHT